MTRHVTHCAILAPFCSRVLGLFDSCFSCSVDRGDFHFLKREQERDLAAFLSSSAILLGLTAENAAANMHALQIGGLAGGRSASFWLGRTSCICFVPSKAKPTLTRVMSH